MKTVSNTTSLVSGNDIYSTCAGTSSVIRVNTMTASTTANRNLPYPSTWQLLQGPFSFANVVEPSSISELPIDATYSSHAKISSLITTSPVVAGSMCFFPCETCYPVGAASFNVIYIAWCNDQVNSFTLSISCWIYCASYLFSFLLHYKYWTVCLCEIMQLGSTVWGVSRNVSCIPRCRFSVLHMHLQ